MINSQGQARMSKEAERELGVATDSPQAGPQRGGERVEVRRTVVGQFAALDIAPERFDRVQLRSVAGQPFDREPPLLAGEVRCHAATLVGGQAIPQQNDPLTAEVALEIPQERDEGGRGGPGSLPEPLD